MSLQTDLNVSPYFDDFDESKNYHRVLFQPKQAVQARELTQLQTILQNQIERFGDSVFQSGTIINGCNFKYDNGYHYVKLRDIRLDLGTNDVSALVGLTATDPVSGLSAVVIDSEDGFETQNPNTKTIFVKYMNTGAAQKKIFAADDTLNFTDSSNNSFGSLSVKVLPTILDGNPTNAVGDGYGFSVSDGVVYQNGFFIRVAAGTSAIVSKYSNTPNNVVVGFTTTENIVTEFSDPSLYDQSAGFSNVNAPGAHRLNLTPVLQTYVTGTEPATNFLVLAEWKNGVVVRENRNTTYSVLGQEFARRTAEESGDYVVNPFVITTSPISGNTTHLNLDTTQGLAYVNGYRVQKNANLSTPLRKATDTRQLYNQQIVSNYGNYVYVKEFCGYFEGNKVQTVSLRDTALASLSTGSLSITPAGTEIGQARLLSVNLGSGQPGAAATTYLMYLTDIRMNSGKTFSQIRSISVSTGSADLVLESGLAVLKQGTFATLIYPLGQKAIKTLRNGANNNTYYTFRTVNTGAKFTTAGTTGTISLSGGQNFPYGIGTLNDIQESSLVITATSQANVTLAKSGTVTSNSANASIIGASTQFQSEYEVGDWFIAAGLQPRRITGIANATYMEVVPNPNANVATAAHAKCYPNNTPIIFQGRQSSILQTNTSSITLTLAASNGAVETLSSNLNVAIVYDVQKASATQRTKQVQENVYVKIACANNAGGTTGPWNLGFPDVFAINAVYVSNNYSEGTAFDQTGQFALQDGQRDGMYSLSTITRIAGTTLSLASTDTLLVKCSVFKHVGGDGFLSIDSYPIDDANTANTTAITTSDIPYFFSTLTGGNYSLRDCIDMRPVCANNAVYSANAASATINPSNTVTIVSATENYVPSPNQPFLTGYEYYLPRMDNLIIDSVGNFTVMEGSPSANPRPPVDVVGTMTLSRIAVQAYPSLSQSEAIMKNRLSYMVTVLNQQTARYTMHDLQKVVNRVDRLEYNAALNLLESQTTSTQVKDASGLNRFQNGIFVDGFDDSSQASINDVEFTVVIDTKNSSVRPAIRQQSLEMKWGGGSNTYNSGELASLAYTSNTLISQQKSSGTRTLGGISWQESPPVPTIYPPYDPTYDEVVAPTWAGFVGWATYDANGAIVGFTSNNRETKFSLASITGIYSPYFPGGYTIQDY